VHLYGRKICCILPAHPSRFLDEAQSSIQCLYSRALLDVHVQWLLDDKLLPFLSDTKDTKLDTINVIWLEETDLLWSLT